jgi:hypothetical protein
MNEGEGEITPQMVEGIIKIMGPGTQVVGPASPACGSCPPYGPGRATTDQLDNPQRLDGLTADVCDGLMGQPDKLHA